jgi:hypothetical protein
MLTLVRLDIVLILMERTIWNHRLQNSFGRTTGSKIVLDAPDGTPR